MVERAQQDPVPSGAAGSRLHLHGWHEPAVIGAALLAAAAGFGQFGAVAALGDVAKHFGHVTHGASIAEQAGLSGTKLGIGLAVLRLASLGGLPLAGLADRFGRRRIMLVTCALGLGLTAVSALSPTYWWFVAIFALGRPLLSATSGVAQVSVAEETSSSRPRPRGSPRRGRVRSRLRDHRHRAQPRLVDTWLSRRRRPRAPPARRPAVRGTRCGRAGPLQDRRRNERAPAPRARGGRPPLPTQAPRSARADLRPFGRHGAGEQLLLYAENVLHFAGSTTALLVASAGLTGLAGLLLGRFLRRPVGRRPTSGGAMIAMALCGMVTYSGSHLGAVIGYLLAVLAASTFAPAAGALTNELFPTSVRAW